MGKHVGLSLFMVYGCKNGGGQQLQVIEKWNIKKGTVGITGLTLCE
jgi:hypothetical protein